MYVQNVHVMKLKELLKCDLFHDKELMKHMQHE